MPKWSSGFVETNEIRIHYHRTGGNKPPLVLAHGLTDNGLCWIRAAQALEQEYDLIMIDARGHGQSDAPQTAYSPLDHAADLAGLIEALALEKPALMGHSMGADNVAALAANYPHLAGCIILEDPPWRIEDETTPPAEIRSEWQQELADYKAMPREELIALKKQEHPTWDEVEFDPWSESKMVVNPNVLQFIGSPGNWRDTVSKITCPALLVTADPEAEAIVTPEIAQFVADTNPNVQVARLRGAGHSIRREQFEPFMDAVKAFLAGTLSGNLSRSKRNSTRVDEE